jgi:hypothetical protein
LRQVVVQPQIGGTGSFGPDVTNLSWNRRQIPWRDPAEGANMLFMLVSRPKPGTKRELLIERLSRHIHPETWDLVRHGALSHILYKVGDEPGFFAVLNAPSLDEAKAMVESAAPRLESFDVDIVPVKHFPHFE